MQIWYNSHIITYAAYQTPTRSNRPLFPVAFVIPLYLIPNCAIDKGIYTFTACGGMRLDRFAILQSHAKFDSCKLLHIRFLSLLLGCCFFRHTAPPFMLNA